VTKFRGLLETTKIHRANAGEVLPDWTQLTHRGRPRGKRSHPEFEQITAYIRKDTHQAVKVVLLKNGGKEFSELLEQLLSEWLKTNA